MLKKHKDTTIAILYADVNCTDYGEDLHSIPSLGSGKMTELK